jgi:hypothetical protein
VNIRSYTAFEAMCMTIRPCEVCAECTAFVTIVYMLVINQLFTAFGKLPFE